MTTRELLSKVLETLPEERLQQLLDFARFLSLQEEQEEWNRSGLARFAGAYGPKEPEYVPGEAKQEVN